MTSQAQQLSPSDRARSPRKLRNYLLEPRFQLKYTGMVMAVTIVVAAVLGHQAYKYSTGQTELLTIERSKDSASADAQFEESIERYAREADRKVLYAILSGIGLLAFALGMTGIVITHRLVGPAYRLKQLLAGVSGGRLAVDGSLRKNDELQDVFGAFQQMVRSLRAAREQDIEDLDRALEQARAAGVPEEALSSMRDVRERLRASLG